MPIRHHVKPAFFVQPLRDYVTLGHDRRVAAKTELGRERDRQRTLEFQRRFSEWRKAQSDATWRTRGWKAKAAKLTGLDPSVVSRITTGKRPANIDHLTQFVQGLKAPELLPADLPTVQLAPGPRATFRPAGGGGTVEVEKPDDLNRVSVLRRKLERLSPGLVRYVDRHQVRDEVIAVIAHIASSGGYRAVDESDETLAAMVSDAEHDLIEQYARRTGAQRGAKGGGAPRTK